MRDNNIFRELDFLIPWQNFYVNTGVVDLEWLECSTVHSSSFLSQALVGHVKKQTEASLHIQSYKVATPGTDARIREALKKQPLEFSPYWFLTSIQEILKCQRSDAGIRIHLNQQNIFYLSNEHAPEEKKVVLLERTAEEEWKVVPIQYDERYWPAGTQIFSVQ